MRGARAGDDALRRIQHGLPIDDPGAPQRDIHSCVILSDRTVINYGEEGVNSTWL